MAAWQALGDTDDPVVRRAATVVGQTLAWQGRGGADGR
jgi:hypothetical protein